MKKQTFVVQGMHCAGCELLIEKKLGKLEGVDSVDAKLSTGKVYIEADRPLDAKELSVLVTGDGYQILANEAQKPALEKGQGSMQASRSMLIKSALVALGLGAAFIALQFAGVDKLLGDSAINLPFVFFVGVIASVSTCMAVVGGLVLSISSSYAKQGKALPLIIFHVARLVSFFLLGGVIGVLGATFALTPLTTFVINFILFIVMLVLGINSLGVMPGLGKFQFRLPKSWSKSTLALDEQINWVSASLLGTVTFILPCGFTQSMQFYALSLGDPWQSALTMFVFALGTLPVLAMISFASVRFAEAMRSDFFFKVAGWLIIFFALFNFTAALIAVGLIPPIFSF